MAIKKKQVTILLVTLLLIPFWMWLAWLLTPKKKFVAIVVDKTVEKPIAEQTHLIYVGAE